jgi:hypothetical protein
MATHHRNPGFDLINPDGIEHFSNPYFFMVGKDNTCCLFPVTQGCINNFNLAHVFTLPW